MTKFKYIALLLITGSLFSCNVNKSKNESNSINEKLIMKNQGSNISKKEAFKLAEEFVVKNGYTNADINPDKKEITFEGIESIHNVKEILKQRFNTLKPKSVGAKLGGEGWIVAFEYIGDNTKTGRAVTMSLSGDNIKMEHQDIMLNFSDSKEVLVENKVKFDRYEEYAFDEDDTNVSFYSIEFILKITNKSEEPVPTLIVDNRSKHVSLLINGKEDNPMTIYNGLTATDAAQYLQMGESDSFNTSWILTPDCGLTKKYGNKFTVQWKYMNHLSYMVEVDIERHTSKVIHKKNN